jgi:hypothetical protein
MPTDPSFPLPNEQWEKFAQARAEGNTLVDSHKLAGYVPNAGNASTLGNRPDIRARIKYLQDEKAQVLRQERLDDMRARMQQEFNTGGEINVTYIQQQLFKNLLMARALGKLKEANEAVKMLGETVGAFDYEPPRIPKNVPAQALGADNGGGANQVSLISGTLDELDDALGGFDPDAGSYPCPSTSGDIPPDFDGDSGESDEGVDGDSAED